MKIDSYDIKIEIPRDILLFCKRHKISIKKVKEGLKHSLVDDFYELERKGKRIPKKMTLLVNYI